ncbi:UDP-glucuronic acid decarboxylase 1-like [Urocitellus parryii]
MRSIQENGELKIESKIEEIVEPLREKIRDLEKSFTQKYPPVKFLSEKDRKRILITGGAGFVGSHLTDKLMTDGHEVTVVDNFFTGRKRNVEHWIGHENFELINHDVVEPLYIEVDQIYHLPSPASPPNYMYNPIKTLKTNTIGTLNMLGFMLEVEDESVGDIKNGHVYSQTACLRLWLWGDSARRHFCAAGNAGFCFTLKEALMIHFQKT